MPVNGLNNMFKAISNKVAMQTRRLLRRGFSDFKIAEEQQLTPESSQFLVSEAKGFLTRDDPLFDLPNEFSKLDEILKNAPIHLPNGGKGLLADGRLGAVVEKELPLVEVEKYTESRVVSALFRDYSYIASMYLLEPCDQNMRKTGKYGLGRPTLPRNIAVPFTKLAAKLNAKPFFEYSHGYVVFNWIKKDPKGDMSPENLILPRRFEGGKDEFWFMAIHLTMVQHSPKLVQYSRQLLFAAERQDRAAFDNALRGLLANSQKINKDMERMWEGSQPKAYNEFRTFIMGTKNQPMFPNGVVYEGVSDEPQFFRGETGANDSMIPTLDNLLQVTAELPQNPLTDILKDFRSYRPKHHNEWLQWVENKAVSVGIKKFAMADPKSAVLMLANLDQIAEFRERHWRFTKEYIIKYSSHPVATGGSPITTWLPNQLNAVLKVIDEVGHSIDESKLSPEFLTLRNTLSDRAHSQRSILKREVDELKKRFPGQDM
jgi:indoleamine 2,3-dioxygenase